MKHRIGGAVFWLLIGAGLTAAFMKHGAMLGGMDSYSFARVEDTFARNAQIALIAGSFGIAICSLLGARDFARVLAIGVGIVGALFAAAFFSCTSYSKGGFVYPVLCGFGPYMYPFGVAGAAIPAVASIAGFVTALLLRGSGSESARDADG